jgi:pyridoxal phosphate enzyme (YggS family)
MDNHLTVKPEFEHQLRAFQARLEDVRRRINASAERSGRTPSEVTLVAVSKTHPASTVREAALAGIRDFGENRLQEAESKIVEIGAAADVRWHLVGHLQANKARRAVKLFDFIHSIDSKDLVARIERICEEEERATLDVLIQVNLASEETKSGVREEELPAIVESLKATKRVRCRGVMTLPPFFEEVEMVRPYFRRLRAVRDELAGRGVFGENRGELSMGMSHDFEVAIEEGATMVRIGTAIFGERT